MHLKKIIEGIRNDIMDIRIFCRQEVLQFLPSLKRSGLLEAL
jgi:hypothetical protein